MPSRRTHGTIGGGLGLVTALATLYLSSEKLMPTALLTGAKSEGDFFAFAPLATFMSWLGGMLPDLLEPGDQNPHHRKFFHSFAILISLAFLSVTIVFGLILTGITQESFYLRTIIFFGLVGYLSHLLLDLFTPYRLPWIK